MKRFSFPLILTALLMMACGGQQETAPIDNNGVDSLSAPLEGDSTIYGLACDGCTDTILVFLPIDDISANPDTFNILNATRRRHIFGHLSTGDKVAVVRNAKDSTVADYVIDMENLRETWCYQVMPTLHVRADMEGHTEKQIVKNLPDSIQQLLSIPREYSIHIKGDHTVRSIGTFKWNEDEDNVIDYPRIKRYGQWHLFNGRLLLTEMAMDSLGQNHPVSTDTAEFILMNRDTLILQFNDGLRHYYPKKE